MHSDADDRGVTKTGCGRDAATLGLDDQPVIDAPANSCGTCKAAAANMKTVASWSEDLLAHAPGAIEWVGSRDALYAMPLEELRSAFAGEWTYLHPYTRRPQPACLPIDLVFVGASFWLEPTYYGWELIDNCVPMGWKNPPLSFRKISGPSGSRLADLNGDGKKARAPVIARHFETWEVEGRGGST